MVTLIKKTTTPSSRKSKKNNLEEPILRTSSAKIRSPRKPKVNPVGVEEAAYAPAREAQQTNHQASSTQPRLSHLLTRGKDLVSGDAASIATTAAIVVGAALIELELIPGLIIGAGAILIGKFFPEMSGYVRPAIKGGIRAGYFVAQKTREVIAEASEQVHDLVAEVKHEQDAPGVHKKNFSVVESAATTH